MSNKLPIKMRILDERIRDYMPAYATPGSAAIDLRACIDEPYNLYPGECRKIKTGFAIHIGDPNYAGAIIPRSGLGHSGVVLGNLMGLIDSDYQGELEISLWNRSRSDWTIMPMDRIAQLVIYPVIQADFIEAESFDASERGEGGFGSTGKS